jgi:hypothetical protein
MILENFISKIVDFDKLSASTKIDYFVYFLTIVCNSEGTTSKDIEECFNKLKVTKYSNIPQYLKNNSIGKIYFSKWCLSFRENKKK